MKPRQQDFVLGLVVLTILGLFVGTLLFVYPYMGVKTRPIVVRFKHEEGMAPVKEGSPVNLGGAMQVGKVKEVTREFIPGQTANDPPQVLMIKVIADIDADLPLYEDCQITTDAPPVGGGGAMVILTIGTPGKKLVVGTTPIDGLPAQSLAAAIGGLSRRLLGPEGIVDQLERTLDDQAQGSLANKISVSLTDINAMTAELRVQLSPLEQRTLMTKLHGIMDHLAGMTGELREQVEADNATSMVTKVHAALDTLASALGETRDMLSENRPGLKATVSNVETMSERLNHELVSKLVRDFDRDDPTSLLGKLHTGMDQLNRSLDNVVVMTDAGRGFMVVNRPALDRMIENLKSVSDQMRTGVQEVLLAPWRLFTPPKEELDKLGVFQAARQFAEAATMLDDTVAKLEAIARDTTSDGRIRRSDEEIRQIQEALRGAFERFQQAETYLFERMK